MGRGKFLRSLKQRWWLLALLVIPITLGTLFYTLLTPAQWEAFMTLADRRPSDVGQATIYQDELARPVNDQEIRVLNLANTISSYSVLKAAYDELTINRTIDKDKMSENDFMNRVGVNPLRGTEYLQVSYDGPKPAEAKKVIDTSNSKCLARHWTRNERIPKQRM